MLRENAPVDKSFPVSHNNEHDSAQDLQQSEELDRIYEVPSLIHDGSHCRQRGCKVCTPKDEVDRLEEIRKKWFEERNKGRNARARAKSKGKILAPIQKQDDQWNPLFVEEFEL
jgi:hypothetical protein